MSFNLKQLGLKKDAGYTMLFAVLVSTVLLSIGIFILNVSKKEVILSAIGRESALAFYAADGGVECAHYYNTANQMFFNVGSNGTATGGTISCGGMNIIVPSTNAVSGLSTIIPPATHQNTVRFLIGVLGTSVQCADVTITKNYQFVPGVSPDGGITPAPPDSYSLLSTTIDSRGYNTCDTGNPRRVERGLRETIQ